MADLDRELLSLLDRAADAPVGDPPVTALLHRGARARRRRHAVQLGSVAAVTAAVVVAAIVLPGSGSGSSPTPLHSATPTPGPTAPPAVVATARQLAHGDWVNIAGAPFVLCAPTTTAWDGHDLLVVTTGVPGCAGGQTGSTAAPARALGYDPAANRWQRLAAPPPALRGELVSVWAGDRLVVVAPASGVAAAWDRAADTWTRLADLPPTTTWGGDTLLWDGARVVALGTGAHGDGTWTLDGARWRALGPLPHQGRDVRAVGGGVVSGTIYAVADDEVPDPSPGVPVTGPGQDEAHLLRLDGDAWTDTHTSIPLPYVLQTLAPLRAGVLIAGSTCPPFFPCPDAPVRALLWHPGSDAATILPPSPLSVLSKTLFSTGAAVLDYNAGGTESGPAGTIGPGAAAAYDVAAGRWLRVPRSPVVIDPVATTWTPTGFVVLGRPAEKCACTWSGVLLRPANSRTVGPR